MSRPAAVLDVPRRATGRTPAALKLQHSGTGDPGWLAALDGLLGHLTTYRPEALVVSLGVDAAGADPESPLDVTTNGFAAAGARLATLGLPTVLVHEGGYALDRLGVDTVAVLRPFGAGDC